MHFYDKSKHPVYLIIIQFKTLKKLIEGGAVDINMLFTSILLEKGR